MDKITQILELKKQLTEEIQKEKSNNNVILELSEQILKLDDNQIRFSVDAGIINRLGKELVGKHETAVSELIKNAFDADATVVNLIYENALNKGGILTIEDNGNGMTRDQLINGFMRLSSSDKIHNPISEKYKRKRAGRKGIGRFATQRLGNKLTIITQTLNTKEAIKLSINWNDFETDKNLLSITNRIELIPKTLAEGTILIIENLRDSWTDVMIKRVFRCTAELLQPFPLSKKRLNEKESSIDPGFKSYYFRQQDSDLIPIIDDDEAIFNHALAQIEGYVLDDGQGCWALKSEKLNFPQEIFLIGNNQNDREDVSEPFNLIKGVHFKVYYFVYDPKLFAPKTFSFIRNLAYERGGIRLYRNGFRVLPYGEQGDDWLGLDKSNNRSVILAPHMNFSFFGFVEIDDVKGDLFEETSSREGLIENNALNELTFFVYQSIINAVMKVSDLRGRKASASQKNFKRLENDSSTKVDIAFSKIEDLFRKEKIDQFIFSTSNKDKSEYEQVFDEFKQAREQEKENTKNLIDENNMLRILAGLGLVIGEFVHEIQRFLPGFNAEINFLKNTLKDNEDIIKRVELLDENVKAFTIYTSFFNKAISRNVFRELEPIELRDIVRDFEKVILNDLKRSNITMHESKFEGYDLFTVPMHPSEWASILFNLYTNSKKAIRRSKNLGQIQIKCGKHNKLLFLEFSDNGDGIPKKNIDQIFNAFFTTTSAANHNADEFDSLVGTGLGLKIVKDIIESYGGEIYIIEPKYGFNTTIRIEIPINVNEKD
ncbi:MAG: ATP-binding protein [Candidatus Kapabacteria bacterium]|nr:ATP-binding protein [Candidatus Kapabacteria bacterium]